LKDKLIHEDIIIITRSEMLEEQHFDYIREYLEWTKPLAAAIDQLQAEINCHYGYLLPTLITIRNRW
jgi:hypothetical protein